MPGLICVLGRSGAAETVRIAARPLLRRPWQRLDLAPTGRDDVALGFAGERGGVAADEETGVVAALDGELFGVEGARTGPEAARELLACYLAAGSGFEPPEGAFAAAFWDSRRDLLTLVTDRYARRPVWTATLGGALLVAGELKALVAAGVEPRLDLETWAQILAYEGPLPGHSPLEGVSLMGGATTMTVTLGRGAQVTQRWRYRLEPDSHGDVEEWAEEFGRLLDGAVARRLSQGVGLALSGGYDSRCVASVVRVRAPYAVALTYGAPGSDDLRLGTRVAEAAGIAHRAAAFGPGYVAAGAAETVWLSEGAIRAFHVHHLALSALRTRDEREGVLIGFGGDHIVRTVGGALKTGGHAVEGDNFHLWRSRSLTDDLVDQVLTPSFAGQIRGVARASLRRHLEAEEGTPIARARQLAYNAQSRKIWPGAELFVDALGARDPYDDHALVDTLRRLPEDLRVTGAVQQAYLRRFPELASLANARDEIPPGLSPRGRRAAELRIRARRGLRRRVDSVVGPRWWPVRRGLGDYASDLRRRGGAGLLGVLLEPRTLERGQVREDAVRRMVEETLSGRGRQTQPLGVLLTLELFQRQFVEGEGFDPTEAVPLSV
jgi:asparagine synthetase B (glutamine-hydrolysing)